MTREWKPGDVAIWGTSDSAREVIFFRLGGQEFDQPGWQTAQDGEGYPRDSELRPLVVIDPEDREQVERLAKALYGNGFTASSRLTDALREFANPTPPPCGASLTLGKEGALYRCSEGAGHEGPHLDGGCSWTAAH